ncbi:hypothetical protein RQP54_11685 [Curvibacter sp. APW13]|uniref:hypothetical protein n=1 Tax=Curvibacter sp. APW13 TaxID=3077236 RepID=UPI0028E077D3|nr:hypothetical protein [Curvibacter sp. APW13]MDT8991522.1 hypothetical protein [Curvibacter sp. APW13]
MNNFTLRMHRRTALVGLLATAACTAMAQTSGNLPLKNLLIEVRQTQQQDTQTHGVNVLGGTPLQSSSRSLNASSAQQSLVLNGRPVRLMSGSNTPWAFYQSYLRNGVIVVLPSTVWVQSGTGFMATPRWSGDGFVELEIQAQADLGNRGAQPGQTTQQSSSSQVLVPLNEWTTIARSDTGQDSQQSGIGQVRNSQSQGSTALQVRVSLP